MTTIAGHEFTPPNSPDARCACGRTWAEIEHVTREHVGQHGLAHQAHLTTAEVEEIIAERERRAALVDQIWGAVVGVSAL